MRLDPSESGRLALKYHMLGPAVEPPPLALVTQARRLEAEEKALKTQIKAAVTKST